LCSTFIMATLGKSAVHSRPRMEICYGSFLLLLFCLVVCCCFLPV
jgi:hypothetical protein